jgi:hypothetical protein
MFASTFKKRMPLSLGLVMIVIGLSGSAAATGDPVLRFGALVSVLVYCYLAVWSTRRVIDLVDRRAVNCHSFEAPVFGVDRVVWEPAQPLDHGTSTESTRRPRRRARIPPKTTIH